MRKLIGLALVLLIAALPARADFGAGGKQLGFWGDLEQFSFTYVTTAADQTDLTNYSFASTSLGTPSPGRQIIVAVSGISLDTGTRSVSSLTVAGITATAVSGTLIQDNGSTNDMVAEHWIAAVPSGTSGTVAVNFNSTMTRATIGVYRMVGGNTTPTATATDNTHDASNAYAATLDIPTGGAGMGNHVSQSTTTDTCTWTNLTEDFESSGAGSQFVDCAASSTTSGSATRTVDGGSGSHGGGVLSLSAWEPIR